MMKHQQVQFNIMILTKGENTAYTIGNLKNSMQQQIQEQVYKYYCIFLSFKSHWKRSTV